MPLAITIVPAACVSNWQVLAGDGPFSRYVAIDLSNQTENEAQLTFGSNNKKTTIVVQPKEICRFFLNNFEGTTAFFIDLK